MGIITEEIRKAGCLELRKKALDDYYSNPNYCKFCGTIILVRIKEKASETKRKQFCSKSCAAKYNNLGKNRWVNKPSINRISETSGKCKKCGANIDYSPLKGRRGYYKKDYCEDCNLFIRKQSGKKSQEKRIKENNYQDWSTINQMTKQEVLEKSGGHSWTMKATITRYARGAYREADLPRTCKACGYDKHINVCHKKDIKDFPMTALIGEINDLNNLIGLCPNHHWEFDHGQLDIN
jgi:hypothetical protein